MYQALSQEPMKFSFFAVLKPYIDWKTFLRAALRKQDTADLLLRKSLLSLNCLLEILEALKDKFAEKGILLVQVGKLKQGTSGVKPYVDCFNLADRAGLKPAQMLWIIVQKRPGMYDDDWRQCSTFADISQTKIVKRTSRSSYTLC